jgi:hypothetical protein
MPEPAPWPTVEFPAEDLLAESFPLWRQCAATARRLADAQRGISQDQQTVSNPTAGQPLLYHGLSPANILRLHGSVCATAIHLRMAAV